MSRLDSLIPKESDLIYRTFGTGNGQERIGTGFMFKPGWDRNHINYHRWDPPTWSLVYVLRGRGTYSLEDGPILALEAGSCFQRRPGTPTPPPSIRQANGPNSSSIWDQDCMLL